MKTYYKKSAAQSKQFAGEVNALVIRGVSPAVAMNIVRWRAKNVRPRVKKFNYDLTLEQLQGPSAKLAEKIKNGTGAAAISANYHESDFAQDKRALFGDDVNHWNWGEFWASGAVNVRGTLYPAHQAWFAKDSYYGLPCIVTEE